jgi:hypothetical protein
VDHVLGGIFVVWTVLLALTLEESSSFSSHVLGGVFVVDDYFPQRIPCGLESHVPEGIHFSPGPIQDHSNDENSPTP